jgi:hypothetical protein
MSANFHPQQLVGRIEATHVGVLANTLPADGPGLMMLPGFSALPIFCFDVPWRCFFPLFFSSFHSRHCPRINIYRSVLFGCEAFIGLLFLFLSSLVTMKRHVL